MSSTTELIGLAILVSPLAGDLILAASVVLVGVCFMASLLAYLRSR